MAPTALTQSPVDVPSATKAKFSYNNPSVSVFPDGIKTAGQCAPDYDKLAPYSAFPEKITGPTVWESEDYQNNSERWTHHFSSEEAAEMGKAADEFLSSGTPLTGITKVRSSSFTMRDSVLICILGQIPSP